MVLLSRRVAIFVHGCFWHRHDGCGRSSIPATRPDYWAARFARNVERDARSEAALLALGWTVVTVWECETRSQPRLDAKLRETLGIVDPEARTAPDAP